MSFIYSPIWQALGAILFIAGIGSVILSYQMARKKNQ